ncbi:hypothetical protein [Nocardioides acrostichi]|uniref:Sulfotransferase family protein n=1 Tax=Nocardioides acrostichi TaxID=2784339 RepID=A0A930UZE5_9ACTN|nr:hypothetical protein [Nocardioides acrostichi]MBF4163708.1 hypothetical protein [Nocardioides acrostichi]
MSSQRRVYVHIGAPKTGTTYVQDKLARNLRSLASHGVTFPSRNPSVSPPLFHFRAALDLLGQDWGGEPGHASGSWDALVRRVRRASGTTIVSHEILAPAPAAAVEKAKRDLDAGDDLHVVYGVRDLARQLPAAWQESIKQGRKWTYGRFLKKVRNRRPWFYRSFDVPSVLGTWAAGLPPENVHVITVPAPGTASRDELWLRFCRVTGIDPAWAPEEATRTNPSLGVAEAAMIRRLNVRLGRVARREAAYDGLVRGLLAEQELAGRDSDKLLLPPRMNAWVAEESQRWVDWIEQAGIDVVGDLADLTPAPVSRGDYVNPDKISPKKQLAAAVDALTAMTQEAARREDPDQQLHRRVMRRLFDQ